MPGSLIFKQADSDWEFEQIHRLNYSTFAREIGQHPADGTGVLVDPFHDQNTYFIALDRERLVGMVAVHDQEPFSIERRLPERSILRALGGPLLEVRLLALEPEARGGMILAGILWDLYRYAVARQYSHLIISALVDRIRIYRKLGFQALGPAVAEGAASFIPMAMALGRESDWLTRNARRYKLHVGQSQISLLPGPVEIAEPVRLAFARRPVSHRSAEFVEAFLRTRQRLESLAEGMRTAILVGSGTAANDAVAAHLRAIFRDEPGLVLANGEFGERLIGQASRAGLRFEGLRWLWSEPWHFEHIEPHLDRARWIWAVHLETSTGMLNDAGRLLHLAGDAGARVALDCVSSIGAVAIPQGLMFATGVSGKALGAYAGLSFVFIAPDALPARAIESVPAYFDVMRALGECEPLFTMPSPLLAALDCALELQYATRGAVEGRMAEYQRLGAWTRERLREASLTPLVAEVHAAPTITTFAAPVHGFADMCRRLGFEIASESGYLKERGWAQIGIMGAIDRATLKPLFRALSRRRMAAANS